MVLDGILLSVYYIIILYMFVNRLYVHIILLNIPIHTDIRKMTSYYCIKASLIELMFPFKQCGSKLLMNKKKKKTTNTDIDSVAYLHLYFW